MNGGKVIAEGKVTELLPNLRFRIDLDSKRMVIGYLSGKMIMHKIKVTVGDRVRIELDPYGGLTTNRITRRL